MLCVAVILEYASSTASSGLVSPSPAARRSLIASASGSCSRARTSCPAFSSASRYDACTCNMSIGQSLRTGQRKVLCVVVAQHQRRDLIGHAGEQRPALGRRERAGTGRSVKQDLDVHLVVGGVDAGRVVDRVGVDAAARERELDAGALGEAEVATFADHPTTKLTGVDSDRVVRPIADVGMRFVCAP